MNFFILASSLALAVFLSIRFRSHSNQQKKIEEAYWDKERKANFIRKKSLDDLAYITIPESILSMSPVNITPTIESYLQDLRALSKVPIVNLTGISNTDLKLTYGTANITILSDYDFHYTNLVTVLQKLAQNLADVEETALAIEALEFAVSTGTDISKTYYLLASLYQKTNTPGKIEFLIQRAESIPSIMKDSIVHNLKASGL